jgi:hypothetical protein
MVKPPSDAVRLDPHRWLFRQALLATAAFLVPVFAVLYFLTIPDGPWVVVLVAQAVASLLFAYAAHSFRRVAVWVSRDGIAERGFFGRLVYLRVADIGSLVLVHTYHGGGADSLPQLFVCSPAGTQVIRLRGQFWSLENMRLIGSTLGVQVTEMAETVSARELLEQYPGLLYWFERRPALASVLFALSVIVGGVLLYVGLAWLGVTTS